MGGSRKASPPLPLSTLALDGSKASAASGGTSRSGLLLRYADLALLALALPIFIARRLAPGRLRRRRGGLARPACDARVRRPRLGRGAEARANGGARSGSSARSTLGRLWLVTLAILLVGLLGEREDGLAAAVLTLALVTVHLACLALSKLLSGEGLR